MSNDGSKVVEYKLDFSNPQLVSHVFAIFSVFSILTRQIVNFIERRENSNALERWGNDVTPFTLHCYPDLRRKHQFMVVLPLLSQRFADCPWKFILWRTIDEPRARLCNLGNDYAKLPGIISILAVIGRRCVKKQRLF